jgi:hypothetical protein
MDDDAGNGGHGASTTAAATGTATASARASGSFASASKLETTTPVIVPAAMATASSAIVPATMTFFGVALTTTSSTSRRSRRVPQPDHFDESGALVMLPLPSTLAPATTSTRASVDFISHLPLASIGDVLRFLQPEDLIRLLRVNRQLGQLLLHPLHVTTGPLGDVWLSALSRRFYNREYRYTDPVKQNQLVAQPDYIDSLHEAGVITGPELCRRLWCRCSRCRAVQHFPCDLQPTCVFCPGWTQVCNACYEKVLNFELLLDDDSEFWLDDGQEYTRCSKCFVSICAAHGHRSGYCDECGVIYCTSSPSSYTSFSPFSWNACQPATRSSVYGCFGKWYVDCERCGDSLCGRHHVDTIFCTKCWGTFCENCRGKPEAGETCRHRDDFGHRYK